MGEWSFVGQTEGSLDRTVKQSHTTANFYFKAWFDVLEVLSHYYILLLYIEPCSEVESHYYILLLLH